jgi:transposase-like protein
MKTKTGAKMNIELKEKIVQALCTPEHEGKTQIELARMMGISPRTIQNYLIKDVWDEIHKRRLDVINQSLKLVDQAVYQKALKGDMTAARILYSRWDQLKVQESDQQAHTLTKQDAVEIKRLEAQIQELENEQNSHLKKKEDPTA